jgi:hypothetical protein
VPGGPKAPTQQVAQHVKTIKLLKESNAKKDAEAAEKDAEVAQLRAEIAQLRFGTPATGQPTQEPAPAKIPPGEAGSPLKRPPPLHVLARYEAERALRNSSDPQRGMSA